MTRWPGPKPLSPLPSIRPTGAAAPRWMLRPAPGLTPISPKAARRNYRRLLKFVASQVNPAIAVREPVPCPGRGFTAPRRPSSTIPWKGISRITRPFTPTPWDCCFPAIPSTNTDGALEAALIQPWKPAVSTSCRFSATVRRIRRPVPSARWRPSGNIS